MRAVATALSLLGLLAVTHNPVAPSPTQAAGAASYQMQSVAVLKRALVAERDRGRTSAGTQFWAAQSGSAGGAWYLLDGLPVILWTTDDLFSGSVRGISFGRTLTLHVRDYLELDTVRAGRNDWQIA